jgi:hypothetical protein
MEYWKTGPTKSLGSTDCLDVQGGIEGKPDAELDVTRTHCTSTHCTSTDCTRAQGETDEAPVYFDDGCYPDYGSEDERAPFLMVVLESRAEGEPKPWSLFVGREGEKGSVYQVKREAKSVTYSRVRDQNPYESVDFHASHIVAMLRTEREVEIVEEYAGSEPPPRAGNETAGRVSSQDWVIGVLRKLKEKGIVGGEWVRMAEGLKESS